MKLNIANWEKIEEKSTEMKSLYRDKVTGEHFAEIQNPTCAEVLYFRSNENGETEEIIGYAPEDQSIQYRNDKILNIMPGFPQI